MFVAGSFSPIRSSVPEVAATGVSGIAGAGSGRIGDAGGRSETESTAACGGGSATGRGSLNCGLNAGNAGVVVARAPEPAVDSLAGRRFVASIVDCAWRGSVTPAVAVGPVALGSATAGS